MTGGGGRWSPFPPNSRRGGRWPSDGGCQLPSCAASVQADAPSASRRAAVFVVVLILSFFGFGWGCVGLESSGGQADCTGFVFRFEVGAAAQYTERGEHVFECLDRRRFMEQAAKPLLRGGFIREIFTA